MLPKRLGQYAARADWVWVGLAVLALTVPWFDLRPFYSADGLPHLFRSVEMDWLLRQGLAWPRYAPDLVYGYGYPLYNYYSPFVYFLMAAIHWLGLDFGPAMNVLFGLAPLVGAAGMYCLARDWYGRLGGGLAAVAYAFSPFLLFTAITRGSLPEVVGLAILPWAFWSLGEAMAKPSVGSVSRWVVLYSALFVHNILALVGSALLGIFGVAQVIWWWMALSARPENAGVGGGGRIGLLLKQFWPAAAGGLVALALTANFWLPALGEISYVQIRQINQPDFLNFRHHFFGLKDWVAWPHVVDSRSVMPVDTATPAPLGLPHLLLALVGVLALPRYTSRAARYWGCFAFAMMAGLLWLTSAGAVRVWEALPLLQFVQFPWRLLAPATLFAALLVGAAFGGIRLAASRWVRWLPLLGLLVLAFHSATWTYARRQAVIVAPGLEAIYAYEKMSGNWGLTSTGEYLPVEVKEMPPVDGLRARYAAQPIIDRLDRGALPEGATVLQDVSQPLEARVVFEAATAFEATFQWFYFPGWQAEVDGKPVATKVTEPFGFIAVAVPAGTHVVRVYFGTTPLRQVALGISLAGFLGLGLLLWGLRGCAKAPLEGVQADWSSAERFVVWTLALGGIGLFGLRLALSGDNHWFFRSPYDGQMLTGAQAMELDFGHQLQLFAWDPPPVQARVGEAMPFTLYWRAFDHPVDGDYSIAAHLVDSDGQIYAASDSWRPHDTPTQLWLPGTYARDEHSFTPIAGTPPGVYRVMVGVYGIDSKARLPGYNPQGQGVGDMVEVGQVTLTEPTRPATDADLAPPLWVKAQLGGVELVGLDLKAKAVKVGDGMSLVAYWRAGAAQLPDLTAKLDWVGPGGAVYELGRFAPVRDDYPSSQWAPGAGLRSNPWGVLIPPGVPGGDGQLELSLETSDGGWYGGPVELAPLTIVAPLRQFALPAVSRPLELRFGAGIGLRGADWPSQIAKGEALTVTLVWESRAVETTRYTVFVHVVDAQGNRVAQHDAQPANGARATTSWLPGEYVVDGHVLTLSADVAPGVYQVVVGMYDSWTGKRLPIATGANQALGDSVALGETVIK